MSLQIKSATTLEQKNATVSNKAREIRDMLKLSHFDSEFSTQNIMESHPFNQITTMFDDFNEMVAVDDFFVSIYELPNDLQEMVRKARAKGEDIHFQTK